MCIRAREEIITHTCNDNVGKSGSEMKESAYERSGRGSAGTKVSAGNSHKDSAVKVFNQLQVLPARFESEVFTSQITSPKAYAQHNQRKDLTETVHHEHPALH